MLYHLYIGVEGEIDFSIHLAHKLTSSVSISQLLADHSSISVVPGVITHCPPLVIDAHLHSTLILIRASHQTNISIGADATCIDYIWVKGYTVLGSHKSGLDIITYLDTLLQHHHSGQLSNWHWSYVSSLRCYSHYHCSQHHPDKLDRHHDQSEHWKKPLHLLMSNIP